MARALVGTPRAYVRCGGCGHARIHHVGAGHGRCSKTTTEVLVHNGEPWAGTFPCDCEHFIQPERRGA